MEALDPFARVLTALRQHGCAVRRKSPDSIRATCPSHTDRNPSLVATRRDGKVLIRCFGGCSTTRVLQALGLKMADLFSGPPELNRSRPVVAAVYDYTNINGDLIARKVRFAPKAFRWQVPDSARPAGFKWGLENASVGLYKLPSLIDARQVLITEGERAVERLSACGFAATCPPNGASGWRERWSEDLWRLGCTEAVILADADAPGRKHAERVALACWQLIQTPPDAPSRLSEALHYADTPSALVTDDRLLGVKLVALPGLPVGGDVVDFLENGGSPVQLSAIIAETPLWTPYADQKRRSDRKRLAARERQRRRRARLKAELSPVSRSVCQEVKAS